MTTTEATVQNRRIEIAAPSELSDGSRVLVNVTPLGSTNFGIDESECRDYPAALADWDEWIKTIEPIEWNSDDPFDLEFRRFNLEAVRKQMQEEAST